MTEVIDTIYCKYCEQDLPKTSFTPTKKKCKPCVNAASRAARIKKKTITENSHNTDNSVDNSTHNRLENSQLITNNITNQFMLNENDLKSLLKPEVLGIKEPNLEKSEPSSNLPEFKHYSSPFMKIDFHDVESTKKLAIKNLEEIGYRKEDAERILKSEEDVKEIKKFYLDQDSANRFINGKLADFEYTIKDIHRFIEALANPVYNEEDEKKLKKINLDYTLNILKKDSMTTCNMKDFKLYQTKVDDQLMKFERGMDVAVKTGDRTEENCYKIVNEMNRKLFLREQQFIKTRHEIAELKTSAENSKINEEFLKTQLENSRIEIENLKTAARNSQIETENLKRLILKFFQDKNPQLAILPVEQ